MNVSDETVAGLSLALSTSPFDAPKTLRVVSDVTLELLCADDESGQDAMDGV